MPFYDRILDTYNLNKVINNKNVIKLIDEHSDIIYKPFRIIYKYEEPFQKNCSITISFYETLTLLNNMIYLASVTSSHHLWIHSITMF